MKTKQTILEEFEKKFHNSGDGRIGVISKSYSTETTYNDIKDFLSKALGKQKREQKNKIVKLKQELANKPVNERGSRGYWLNRVEEEL